MKQLCGMACGDTRECVFFTSTTTPLYSMQCTVVDMSASLAEIWYFFFVHNGAITNLTPVHPAREDEFEAEICKNCNSGYKS